MLLDCRPGDRVLDLGAGSGFSSKMLARFGYEVVAIDPDLLALSRNRSRAQVDIARLMALSVSPVEWRKHCRSHRRRSMAYFA